MPQVEPQFLTQLSQRGLCFGFAVIQTATGQGILAAMAIQSWGPQCHENTGFACVFVLGYHDCNGGIAQSRLLDHLVSETSKIGLEPRQQVGTKHIVLQETFHSSGSRVNGTLLPP